MKISISKVSKVKMLNILGIVFIFLIWHILSLVFDNSLIIPRIFDVFKAMIEMFKTQRIYTLIIKLLLNGFLTITVSFAIGMILALLSFKYEWLYNFMNPMITFFKTVPIIAIIILLLISVMSLAPYVASFLVVVPIIYEGVYMTLKQIDSNITDDIKTLSNLNFPIIIKFYIPLILPNIITSLVQSFGLGIKVMVMAEYTSPKNNTFGAEIKRFYDNNDMEKVYAMVILLIVFSFVVDKILKKIRKNKEY